mgnify:CR=1 FL=1
MRETIYLNMPVSEMFGWGVCGRHLLKEFSKCYDVRYIEDGYTDQIRNKKHNDMVNQFKSSISEDVNAPFIHTISSHIFKPVVRYKGEPNIGYIFFETENIPQEFINNLKESCDVIVAGSQWNVNILKNYGIDAELALQGVDQNNYLPRVIDRPKKFWDKFIIFSGGKYEHRKAQDIVIKAVAELQKRHEDVLLLASWINIFDEKYNDISNIEKEIVDQGVNNYHLLPMIFSPSTMAYYMNMSDIGLFPNRYEGGTNLVLMEYLACSKPVIANVSTGQSDVLKSAYSFNISGNDDDLLDSAISYLEYAYDHRDEIKHMGKIASDWMCRFSWQNTAEEFTRIINKYKGVSICQIS